MLILECNKTRWITTGMTDRGRITPAIKGTQNHWVHRRTQRHHQPNKVHTLSVILTQWFYYNTHWHTIREGMSWRFLSISWKANVTIQAVESSASFPNTKQKLLYVITQESKVFLLLSTKLQCQKRVAVKWPEKGRVSFLPDVPIPASQFSPLTF